MTTPSDATRIRISEHPNVHVEVTGPTEAAVLRRAAEWLDSLDGAVVVLAVNWRGDVGELVGAAGPLHQMILAVDMSVAVNEGRWPRDWFPGSA